MLVVAATAYWYFAGATAVVSRVVPAVAGWTTAAVVGTSMEPALGPGDVVAFASLGTAQPAPGAIIAFEDPGHAGVLITHRVVAVNADGSFHTKGDANAAPDSTPVARDQVLGIARLVTPGAGLPVYWWESGQTLALVAWLVLSIAALVFMTRPLPDPAVRRQRLAPIALAGLVIGSGPMIAVTANFSAATVNSGNYLTAALYHDAEHIGTTDCGTGSSQVTIPSAIPAGRTVVITLAVAATTGGPTFAATDSRGNTYTVDAIASDGNRTRVAI
ncbi:MAG TPA: signal peptidase I, partial [Actinobacteria bacterium]|nr:signal peptidase I [Actinomycetota bacterium]